MAQESAHLSFPLRKSLLAAHRPFPLLGLSPRQEPPCGGCAPKRACGRSPAHTLYPQGVCSIRKAAKPLTAALPYRRGEFTTLSTASFLFIQPLFYTKSSPTARGPSASCKLFRFPTIFVEHLRPLCYTGCCNIVYCVPTQDIHKKGGCANGKPCCHHHLRRGIHIGSG